VTIEQLTEACDRYYVAHGAVPEIYAGPGVWVELQQAMAALSMFVAPTTSGGMQSLMIGGYRVQLNKFMTPGTVMLWGGDPVVLPAAVGEWQAPEVQERLPACRDESLYGEYDEQSGF
jgi:hypothetical protein